MSHFSTVKTELRQLEPLVKALEDMGYAPDQGARPVRGLSLIHISEPTRPY